MTEIWKPIPGEPFYEASSLGRIRSVDRVVPFLDRWGNISQRPLVGRVLRAKTRKAAPGKIAYRDVVLCSDGNPHSETVHKLVALAFHGERPTPLHEVAHGNGDPSNNRPDNVRWATSAENKADSRRAA